MHALEQTDRDRIGNGVGQFLIFYLLQQLRCAQFRINLPAQVGVFLLFQLTQILDHHMAGRNGQLLIVNGGQRAWPQTPDAIDQLLRNGVIGRARLIVFATLTVIDQTGCQYVGIVVIKIVEQLVDILANGNFKLHAKIIGELLRQFIIKANNFAVNVAVNQRRVERTDAQLPPLLNGGDTVFGFAEPGDGRPEGHCQQQRNNADEQIINL